ncbi:hypothetical protein AQ505_14545 [Pedobacter sp. PACM 27299]|nr:hypothetical protein AQ505_14545 [Pedobacter sp. PACM 27299]
MGIHHVEVDIGVKEFLNQTSLFTFKHPPYKTRFLVHGGASGILTKRYPYALKLLYKGVIPLIN